MHSEMYGLRRIIAEKANKESWRVRRHEAVAQRSRPAEQQPGREVIGFRRISNTPFRMFSTPRQSSFLLTFIERLQYYETGLYVPGLRINPKE